MGGIFGDALLKQQIEKLKREKQELQRENERLRQEVAQWKAYGQSLGGVGQTINENLECLLEQVQSQGPALERIECKVADIQSLSDAIDAQGQTIQQEAQEVKTQLDQMNATIAELRGQVNPDVQPLVDRLAQNTASVQAIFTGETPPNPEPAPGRGRR